MEGKLEQALITGGEGSLAKEISVSLCNGGMKVHAPSRAELDVTSQCSVDYYFQELEELDLLVCNAGVTRDGSLMKLSEYQWDEVMDVNLKGAFRTARAAVEIMLKRRENRKGHIVFTSSYSAYHPPAGQANYAAAKAGLEGFAKSLAQEVGSRNIRVNVVVPGFMDTRMTEDLPGEVKQLAKNKHLLGRYNTPEKVAEFICFLHQQMEHTSGQVFNLDSRIL